METIFKKIHEGLDLFNYYLSRHEALNNDSQREKLEGDLKKEIKKLQKFRDQIKNWQGNEALETTIAPLKLQEHRRLVEEAMECYKEVEKNSKMKSFSNQSIMLALMDNGELELSPEVQEMYEYLGGVVDELTEQNERHEEEYERLAQKKTRKNALLAVEERKQEIEAFRTRNEFHIEKIQMVMAYLRASKVAVELVQDIQDDLNFYVESNMEPDFVDDETVYDDLIREAKENHERNIIVEGEHADAEGTEQSSLLADVSDLTSTTAPRPKALSASPAAQDSLARLVSASSTGTSGTSGTNLTAGLVLGSNGSAGSATAPSSAHEPAPASAGMLALTPKGKVAKSLVLETSSPNFVTTLKPALTPSKPVGALKWSLAAAGAANADAVSPATSAAPAEKPVEPREEKPKTVVEKSGAAQTETDVSLELLSLLTKTEEYSPYLQVLKNSGLPAAEFLLFSQMDLLKVPPGIQDLAVSFTAENKVAAGQGKLLVGASRYDPIGGRIAKPYLPEMRSSDGQVLFKAPLFLGKLQNYWTRIRVSNQFDRFLSELEMLEEDSSSESSVMSNELTMVLFYGYYYGFLPLENIIAESMLHKLGWRPYEFNQDATPGSPTQTQLWLRKVKDALGKPAAGDAGDYSVFDLSSWEIHMKLGFKYDARFSRSEPVRALF